jgi:hypothetical protein
MFHIVVCDNDSSRNVFQCQCGCQETHIVKRSFQQSTWRFAPIVEKEFLSCARCGAEQERGTVPVKLGSQNFPRRNSVWDSWMCDCGKTSRKARVTYSFNIKSCPKCGKECPQSFKQEIPYSPNRPHH